jgi:hypothetical protein
VVVQETDLVSSLMKVGQPADLFPQYRPLSRVEELGREGSRSSTVLKEELCLEPQQQIMAERAAPYVNDLPRVCGRRHIWES